MNDYEQIACVVRRVDKRRDEKLDLTASAAQVGLSLSEFHRLFSDWAGITPQDFLRGLTVSHVKGMLRDGESDLGVALRLPASRQSPALDVSLEVVVPGEMASGGEGRTITAGFGDSPFGRCLIGECERGVCCLSFVESGDEKKAWGMILADWPGVPLR